MSQDSRDILLIEPSPTQRYVLVKMLRSYGYEISVAESFDAGVDFLSHPDQLISHPPAIVLSWPEQTIPAADDLLSLLESEP